MLKVWFPRAVTSTVIQGISLHLSPWPQLLGWVVREGLSEEGIFALRFEAISQVMIREEHSEGEWPVNLVSLRTTEVSAA